MHKKKRKSRKKEEVGVSLVHGGMVWYVPFTSFEQYREVVAKQDDKAITSMWASVASNSYLCMLCLGILIMRKMMELDGEVSSSLNM